ncbi:tyrosine-type recombinase/integrase [Spirosoma areae]
MIKVTLRSKPISKGRKTIYLDFYPAITHPDTGKPTRREFLGMYIVDKPKTTGDKQLNKDTLAIAEGIRARRQLAVHQEAFGFLSTRKRNACFVRYFEQLANKRSGSNRNNWRCSLLYLKDFTGGTLRFTDLTAQKCREFKEYMSKAKSQRNDEPLALNSSAGYFNKFKAALRQAYKDEYISIDLDAQIDRIKGKESHREYLTQEELTAVAEADCAVPVLKKAGLFAALTGLRFSDIHKLTWGELRYRQGDGYSIQFRQKKTQGAEFLPIADMAVELLGGPGQPDELVFAGLNYAAHCGRVLKQWIANAGKTKKFGFHCFRHTYATLQLTMGTDLFTTSKMMTHSSVTPTQIYAKVVDSKKREAANKMHL